MAWIRKAWPLIATSASYTEDAVLTNTWDSRDCGWQLKIAELAASFKSSGSCYLSSVGHRDTPG